MARNRIKELRSKQSARMWEELMQRQESERQEVEQSHILEYQQFNKNWDEEAARMQAEHERLVYELENQHVKQLEENRQKLEGELPTMPKPSSEVLNLKKIQDQLGI